MQIIKILVVTGSSGIIPSDGSSLYYLPNLPTDTLRPKGMIQLKIMFGTPPRTVEVMVDFLIVDVPTAYNAILWRGTLNKIGAIVSSPHLKIKFHTDNGVGEECGQQRVARECYLTSLRGQSGSVHQVDKHSSKPHKPKPGGQLKSSRDFMPPNTPIALDPTDKAETKTAVEPAEDIEQVDLEEGKTLNIGKAVQGQAKEELIQFLREHQSIFAWTTADMPGIPRAIAEHKLRIKPGFKPVRQKKRNMGEERQRAVKKEVEKLLKAGFIRNVACPE